jgi:hypothetical protein
MKLTANDKTIIARCVTEPAVYTFHPKGEGVKYARFNMPPKYRVRLHELALAGYVSETVTGCGGVGCPPETTITFAATALGREAVDHYRDVKPLTNFERVKTDAQLLAESQEP